MFKQYFVGSLLLVSFLHNQSCHLRESLVGQVAEAKILVAAVSATNKESSSSLLRARDEDRNLYECPADCQGCYWRLLGWCLPCGVSGECNQAFVNCCAPPPQDPECECSSDEDCDGGYCGAKDGSFVSCVDNENTDWVLFVG